MTQDFEKMELPEQGYLVILALGQCLKAAENGKALESMTLFGVAHEIMEKTKLDRDLELVMQGTMKEMHFLLAQANSAKGVTQ